MGGVRVVLAVAVVVLAVVCACSGSGEAASWRLSKHYYKRSCPSAEAVVRQAIRNATKFDPKVPPRILRMYFHDCFIRGCDASVLLDSTPENKAEKDAPPNISLRAFYVIDDAKTKLEAVCPHTVSCADILAIAARDVVVLSGGPAWEVLKGRKDGLISRANETRNLPSPNFNVTQLIQSFAVRGLSVRDLVALSGGHTLGFSHCSSFQGRLHNSNQSEVEPAMETELAQGLGRACPPKNSNGTAGAFLDSTGSRFDNAYFRELVEGKGVLASDEALYLGTPTKSLVDSFASHQLSFFSSFARSMIKLGNVGVRTSGQVRLHCRRVNTS